MDVRPALFGVPKFGDRITDVAALTSPPDACANVSRVGGRGSIFVVDRGNCDFVTKVRNCELAGAAAVVVVDNTNAAVLPCEWGALVGCAP